MECGEALILISGHIDGQNAPQEEDALRAHLLTCPDCRALLRTYQDMEQNIAALNVPAPDGLASKIMAQIPKTRRKKRSPWLGIGASAGVAAAVLAVLIGTKTIPLPKRSGGITEAPHKAAQTEAGMPMLTISAPVTEAPAEDREDEASADGTVPRNYKHAPGSGAIIDRELALCAGLSKDSYAAVLLYSGIDTSFFEWLSDCAPELSERLRIHSSSAVDSQTGIITVTSDYTTVTALHEWFRYVLLSEDSESVPEGDVRDEINAQFSVYGLDGSHIAACYDFPQDCLPAGWQKIFPRNFVEQWFTGENWRLFYPEENYQPDAEDLAYLVLIPPQESP